MHRYLQLAMLGSALLVAPVTAFSQDRDHHDERYEDRAHHDAHEWNERENEAYRRYLKEVHRTYREFNRLSEKERDKYWAWRHRHTDDDHR